MAGMSNFREHPGDNSEEHKTRIISYNELESRLELMLVESARDTLQHMLETLEEQNPAPLTRCHWCGGHACYDSNRFGFVRTRFGIIRYRRACYICPHCHHNTYPLDERLNPYASLARLRRQLAMGNILPVDELASAWGLGSLEILIPAITINPQQIPDLSANENQVMPSASDIICLVEK